MKPISELLKTRFNKDELVDRLRQHPEQVETTIQISLQPDEPQGWRAAWVLKSILLPNDSRLSSHMDQLLAVLPNRPDGHQRELLYLILSNQFTEEQEGLVFDHCLTLWSQVGKSSSVRYLALRHLARLTRKYPELVHELEVVTEKPYLESLSPGIRSTCEKIISEFQINQ